MSPGFFAGPNSVPATDQLRLYIDMRASALIHQAIHEDISRRRAFAGAPFLSPSPVILIEAKNPGILLKVNSVKSLQFAAGKRSNTVILHSAQDDSTGGLADTPRFRKCRNSSRRSQSGLDLNRVGFRLEVYSYRRASIGSTRDALRAGR